MSIFSVFNASFIGRLLVGIFCWKPWLIIIFLICFMVSMLIYVYEGEISKLTHYEVAFWLFIFREIMVFGSLLFCCLYYDVPSSISLSDPLEIPFMGCFLLLGSSITVTGFHHLLGWKYSWVLLLFTVILGFGFVGLQLYEVSGCEFNLLDSRFYASRFCVVGAHFRHVLLGVIGLSIILLYGVINVGEYYCTVITWYWHFVDYVWLFVYLIVYVC